MHSYTHVLAEARTAVWLMRQDKLEAIMGLLEARAAGIQADAATLEMFAADTKRRAAVRAEQTIGVLPIIGSIVQRGNLFTESSGTASTDVIGRQFDALMANEQVGTIVLEFDSPGGVVTGIPELANKIQSARGTKPIIAAVNAEAASAAYWLASAADEITLTTSGEVGSIGAYCLHLDQSGLNAAMGVKPTFISYGRYKTEGNPHEPLPDETRAELQRRVDGYGQMFETAIAKNRGVSVATVRADWGQGRMLNPEQAKAAGMVDKLETFQETIERLLSRKPMVNRRLAHAKRMLDL